MPFHTTPVYARKAELFRTLGHPVRVRILELLHDGEMSVGALQQELGLDSGGTSQHLGALRRIGVVTSRREGTGVWYSVPDPHVFALLKAGKQILARTLMDQQDLLRELSAE